MDKPIGNRCSDQGEVTVPAIAASVCRQEDNVYDLMEWLVCMQYTSIR